MNPNEPSGPMFTPREIVSELDRYIVGQSKAKRMVAIALRNRWRRQQVSDELREEITPKNIIMIGPTGVGKTEIARRLAKLAQAPFVKVEASKFTEVGYVGRDVDSMIRDLVEVAIQMVRAEEKEKVKERARDAAEDRILDVLMGENRATPPRPPAGFPAWMMGSAPVQTATEPPPPEAALGRDKLRQMLIRGELDQKKIEIETQESSMPMLEVVSPNGSEEMGVNLKDMLSGLMPKRTKKRKLTVQEALELFSAEEAQRLIDMDKVTREALRRAETAGIVFIDEIDKIAGRQGHGGPDVSREGVQRDILPIIEGSTVSTKYGPVKTDHILFIAAGAFHVSKVSDLIPELQGRFPIRVELESLTQADFFKILTEPKNSLTKQYVALLKTEGIALTFTEDAVQEMSEIATRVNAQHENIGARRLHTILERVLEDLSFRAPEMQERELHIDAAYVRERLKDVLQDQDLARYIL